MALVMAKRVGRAIASYIDAMLGKEKLQLNR